MATLPVQQGSILGLEVAFSSCAGGGDKVDPSAGQVKLLVRNADSGSHTVTIARPGTEYGQAVPDVVVAVAAGKTEWIGPIPASFADTDGLVAITYSAVTSMTVAAVRG